MKPPDNEYVEPRGSDIHGQGLFAKKTIPRGALIIQYLGEKISKEESNRRGVERQEESEKTGAGSVYIFELDDDTDLDGAFDWNIARLANHSCQPNAEAQNIDGEIWLVALRKIHPGQEVTFDYGYDLSFYKDHPCKCGSPRCVGYIVRRTQRKQLQKLLQSEQQPSV